MFEQCLSQLLENKGFKEVVNGLLFYYLPLYETLKDLNGRCDPHKLTVITALCSPTQQQTVIQRTTMSNGHSCHGQNILQLIIRCA